MRFAMRWVICSHTSTGTPIIAANGDKDRGTPHVGGYPTVNIREKNPSNAMDTSVSIPASMSSFCRRSIMLPARRPGTTVIAFLAVMPEPKHALAARVLPGAHQLKNDA